MAIDSTTPRSRRALLAASLGGLAALAAQALGRPAPARAEGDTMVVGGEYTATSVTRITNTANDNDVLWGETTRGGIAVFGSSRWNTGVSGLSSSGYGVEGVSESIGVHGLGFSDGGVYGSSGSGYGVFGSSGSSAGLFGYHGPGDPPVAPLKTGVYGHATQDSGSRGVWGRANAGRGVYGQATSGYGVYGYAASGTAAYFKGGDGTGKALNAQGRVFFRTAGLATIGAGSSSSGAMAAGVDLVSSSKILATLEGNPGAGVTIHRVTKSTAADTLTVYLTGPAANACKVAWFVIG